MRALLLAALAGALAGCGEEPLLHDLAEREANQVLVALDEGGIAAVKVRSEGSEAGWTVAVPRGEGPRAQRLLQARQLPRPRPAGLGEVFGQAGVVPTPVEEHARWLHALAGELAASVEALDGVVEARVHLGLPAEDPLRPGARPAARAAVLVKCRPAACDAVRALEGGLRALVAGAADGLSPEQVAVVIAPGVEPATPAPPARRPTAPLVLALLGAAGAATLGGLAWRERRRLARSA
ncbi:MAG: secretion protein [Anaeromyxobacter sp.]|nr:secretion protein [Anaeromyxobacter sp.]MBL0275823.1 secretion protein [Anaeromyxobacter sp.]